MKMFATLTRAALFASVLVGTTAAYADALVATDPIQLGRLSRNNVSQDWSHFELDPTQNGEQFPGVINPTAQYHYRTFFYNVGSNPWVEISIYSPSTNIFFSAYQTFYNPTNLMQDWLGDGGSSGDYSFSTTVLSNDGRYFQVKAGANTTLVLVVNETTPNAGLGAANAFDLTVTGHIDSQYTDGVGVDLTAVPRAQAIPEPSTMLLLAFAPLALVTGRRARNQKAKAASLAMA